jgi:hypothetical protein
MSLKPNPSRETVPCTLKICNLRIAKTEIRYIKDDIKINLQIDIGHRWPRYETKTQRMLISLSPCFSLQTNFIMPWLLVMITGHDYYLLTGLRQQN